MRTILNTAVLSLRYPPKLMQCEICNATTVCVRTDPHPLPGTRCIRCRGTAKHRGLYKVLMEIFGNHLGRLSRKQVYEMSTHGALFNALARDSQLTGFDLFSSEYMDDRPSGTVLPTGIRCENVEALSFPNRSFDLITCTEVFEHVENEALGFAEIARVLKPNGVLVFTVPLENAPTLVRARRKADGSLEHLAPAEYHGDPFRGSAGVFTWRTYGTDITSRMAPLTARVHMADVAGTSMLCPVVVAHCSG
jgi:SAM-dependent methyltransferase